MLPVGRKIKRKFRLSTMKPTKMDRALAKVCLTCPVCRHARRRQAGVAFRLVKNIEGSVCPFCQAYERVYGRKAHERA
jgi:hypothetical protein